MNAIDSVTADRVGDYLDYISMAEAAEYYTNRNAPRPFPIRAGLPRMDMAADAQWREAWRRGLVSDPEMAWFLLLINRHPYSWLGWLRGGTGEWS